MVKTKLIYIEIEKPMYCPYRVVCVHDDKKLGMMCVRCNRICDKQNTFPDWCILMDGRDDD